MATYYPCAQSASAFCTNCNTVQNPPSSCTSSSSQNSSSNASSCSAYCNVGCNSSCNTAQTVCQVHSQYIKNHADVGGYPGSSVAYDSFIYSQWNTSFWSSLITNLEAAENVGRLSSQGSSIYVARPATEQVITADFYNNMRTKLTNFNVNYAAVAKDDLITATTANAIQSAYNNATFDSTVCDACNSNQTVRAGCGCNCSCSCSCNCGCSCPCPCNCGCNCSCSCNCGCNCSCNCSSPAPSK